MDLSRIEVWANVEVLVLVVEWAEAAEAEGEVGRAGDILNRLA